MAIIVAMLGLGVMTLVGATVWVVIATRAESPPTEQSAEVLRRSSRSNAGKLAIDELARVLATTKEIDDPTIWGAGYLTEDNFVPPFLRRSASAKPAKR